MLETAPSFSIYSNNKEDNETQNDTQNTPAAKDFSFGEATINIIKEEVEEEETIKNNNENVELEFGEMKMDEISEDLLHHYPNNPLLLTKFPHFMQKKGDLKRAEEYYSRAVQADPGDGESLSQYAQLVWELHHDHGRALTYFDLAAQTDPNNSNVMAAYAKFLWETEDEEEDQSSRHDSAQESNLKTSVHLDWTDGIDADTDDVVSYYKRMIDENPSDPVFLKKYAQFLYQSKGDLQSAEEYYSRAILAEPQDGELLLQFATLLWELYHDQERTLGYLERAIEAAPQNSDVLAAYARILWTVDDE